MWTSDNFKYHPSWWRDWEFEHTGVDSPSRIYDQNFGPGTRTFESRRRVHNVQPHLASRLHMPHFGRSRIPFPDPYFEPFPPLSSPTEDKATLEKTKDVEGKPPASECHKAEAAKEQRLEDLPPAERGMSEVINDKDKFQVTLDVAQFTPEEMTVKTVDQYLVVECKHEERPDEHGFISRSFTRKYILPKDVDPVTVQSSLAPEGTLMVYAPKQKEGKPAERKIRIDMGPPMSPK